VKSLKLVSILVTVDPRPPQARILVVNHLGETLLKARLERPILAKALPSLLEALTMWTGIPVRCAFVVDPEGIWCAMGTYGVYGDERDWTPLYQIEVVSNLRHFRRRRDIDGMGDFRDLRQLRFSAKEPL
jgi:hypothetical protein